MSKAWRELKLSSLSRWMSRRGLWALSTNRATILSVDLLPGPRCEGGSCGGVKSRCPRCYGYSGKQAMRRARQLQAGRLLFLESSPEAFGRLIVAHLVQVNLWLRAHGFAPMGTKRDPLRLFGVGDGVSAGRLVRLLRALRRMGVVVQGFSRLLGLGPEGAGLFYSCGSYTPIAWIDKARAEGRRLAWYRGADAEEPPADAAVVFPDHQRRRRIVRDERDCWKLRHRHGVGPCLTCGRCQ